MAIQRWDPERDLVRLQDHVNRMFEEVLSRSSTPDGADLARPGDWKPPLDLFEEPGHFVLRADLPGVAATAVEIRIEEDRLVLVGERRNDQESYLRLERPFGRFSAQIALPASVDRERSHASHRNGVLEVVLPKKKEAAPSRIDVAGA